MRKAMFKNAICRVSHFKSPFFAPFKAFFYAHILVVCFIGLIFRALSLHACFCDKCGRMIFILKYRNLAELCNVKVKAKSPEM